MSKPTERLRQIHASALPLTRTEYAKLSRDIVRYFFGKGSKNIAIINQLISVATGRKGLNKEKLVLWLEEVIPHKLVRSKEEVRFGERIPEWDGPDHEQYLTKNPNFFDLEIDQFPGGKKDKTENALKALLKWSDEINPESANINSHQISGIENLIHKLEMIVIKSKAKNIGTSNQSPNAHFVSGGLPSLGKRRP